MTTYNHMFTVAFTVVSKNGPEDVTAEELRHGLTTRLRDLYRLEDEILEACGLPVDTYIEEVA